MNFSEHSITPCDNWPIISGCSIRWSICPAISVTTCLYECMGILMPHFSHTTPTMPQWSRVMVGTAHDIASQSTVGLPSPSDEMTCRCAVFISCNTSVRGILPCHVMWQSIPSCSDFSFSCLNKLPSPMTSKCHWRLRVWLSVSSRMMSALRGQRAPIQTICNISSFWRSMGYVRFICKMPFSGR